MKRFLVISLLLFATFCSLDQTEAQPKQLVILHTNDMHASFVPHEAYWVKQTPKPMVGGFKELSFAVDSIRKIFPAALLLDAGDVMTGNPITERTYRGAYGGALFEMMNLIGYDAWCPGNHDFDVSQENLRLLTGIARFPTLCANIVNAEGVRLPNTSPYVIIEKNGLRIGIIGVISQELYQLVNQNNLVGLKVLSPVETLQKYADELLPKTDMIIALTHQGFDEDSAMAVQLRNVDIIVGGHSHTRIKKPRAVNGIIIVQAGSNCENLGELELTVENHRVTRYDGHLNQLWSRENLRATPVTSLVDSMKTQIDKEYGEVIGTLESDWFRGNGPSGVGSFISEAQREAAAAEIGFMNNHGIRKDLPVGPITKKDLFEVLPFRNILTTFELSGAQVREVVRYYLEQKPAVQMTGLSAHWKKSAGGAIEITTIEVQGKPLDNARMYKCAASDFLVGDARHYLGVEIQKPYFLQQTVFEAVEKAVRSAKRISTSIPYTITEER
jgi:5'-nucleotidase/UDP-sugar diphosphatase